MSAFLGVTVSVSNLEQELVFWRDVLGLVVVAETGGAAAEQARRLQVSSSSVCRQTVLGTEGSSCGWLHLIEYESPGEAVRRDAATTDSCPKNLDIYVRDLPARVAQLEALGYRFHGDYTELVAADGTRFREIHLPYRDGINLVLLELPEIDVPIPHSNFAAVGPLVTTVPEAGAESLFYRSVLGLEELATYDLDGPEIEAMIGLPKGAGLDVRILGSAQQYLGRIEVIEYRGGRGIDRYPLAVPPATGILGVSFLMDDVNNLSLPRGEFVEASQFGRQADASLRSPAGFAIDLFTS